MSLCNEACVMGLISLTWGTDSLGGMTIKTALSQSSLLFSGPGPHFDGSVDWPQHICVLPSIQKRVSNGLVPVSSCFIFYSKGKLCDKQRITLSIYYNEGWHFQTVWDLMVSMTLSFALKYSKNWKCIKPSENMTNINVWTCYKLHTS